MIKPPIATYRLQFNAQFTFNHAKDLVDYLHKLGISHCYASPILRAKAGSTHGYDIIDHTALNPELGTEQDFASLITSLKDKHMGMLLDIVPNHMYVAEGSNVWWRDVLENGPSSLYAEYFDIDWNPVRAELVNKVLLPLLELQYGDALESQMLQVEYREGALVVAIPGTTLPTDPKSWNLILDPVEKEIVTQLTENDPQLLELQSIITAVSHLPLATDLEKEKVSERQREKEVIKRRLEALLKQSPSIEKALNDYLLSLNGKKDDPHSFDALEKFLNTQSYRLCYWRVANDEINYRRFFDVVQLAGIRAEKPEVFDAIHALIFQFVQKNDIDGLRIDHIDGLLNPEQYLRNLQAHCSPAYVVGEKILTGNEKLCPEWQLQGTVGYDFCNQVNGIFVFQPHRKAILDFYASFTDIRARISEQLYASKKLILLVSMSSELYVLTRHLDRISEQHRSSRDFTTETLRGALRDTIASFPVYRSYIDAPREIIHDEDRAYVTHAINRAKRLNPAISSSVFDFLYDVLLLNYPSGISALQKIERDNFVMRFQQLTSPVMAKGVEDTAFYRYYPLASLNEVGGDLYNYGLTLETFHEKNRERLENWPLSLTTTSTHDTKRSEDVRARINVISEIPDLWREALLRWSDINQQYKGKEGDDAVPDNNEEYLFYQTVVGTWPLYPMDTSAHLKYMNRIQAYMEKAIKEAKVNTSWINPNKSYDQKVRQFIQSVLEIDTTTNPFIADFKDFIPKVIRAGMLNSLTQVLLKATSPGIPDFYQGNELWDFSLVDPDNRRPIDFENRKYLLQALFEGMKKQPHEYLHQMLQNPEDGKIKLYLTTKLLHSRIKDHELFTSGAYLPLEVTGEKQEHVIAFLRSFKNRACLVIGTRFFMTLMQDSTLALDPEIWQSTKVLLPQELQGKKFRNIFTKQELTTDILLSQAMQSLPFAVLEAIE